MCEKNANDRKTDRRRRVNVGAYMTYDSLDGRLTRSPPAYSPIISKQTLSIHQVKGGFRKKLGVVLRNQRIN